MSSRLSTPSCGENINTFDHFDTTESELIDDFMASEDPAVVEFLIAEDRDSLVEQTFHVSVIATMLNNMRQFSRYSHQRPFFDFCRREARYYIDIAKGNLEALRNAVTELKKAYEMLSSPTPESPCHWPDSRVEYEPEFGIEELKLLRHAGEPGLDLLNRPFSSALLPYADMLIGTTKEQLAALPRQPDLYLEKLLEPVEAWLQQEK